MKFYLTMLLTFIAVALVWLFLFISILFVFKGLGIAQFKVHQSSNTLIQTAKEWKVQSVQRPAVQHKVLQELAEKHARDMATLGVLGHFGSKQRFKTIQDKIPTTAKMSECVAMNNYDSEKSAAEGMFKSWKGSPPHWSSINGTCTYYGYAMSRNLRGEWYACAIFSTDGGQ
jgi:uncharacterized protein YkwD